MSENSVLLNYVGGQWIEVKAATEVLEVKDPATNETLGRVPLSASADVDEAVSAAQAAFPAWRETPPVDRIQPLFRLKNLLEDHFDDIARTVTLECGKTLPEARGEVRRAIQNIEVATGIPSLMMGYNLEDIARGIDEYMIRQPLGVVTAVTPFNFPAMVPLWFIPYAVACGNTFILKPSERVPLSMQKVFRLVDAAGFPPGVLNLVNGSKDTVDALLDHPKVRAVSFVGSTPVARYIYQRAASNGKRAQCQGGAKNFIVVMPDADINRTVEALTESAFGCAGQRCLAGSIAMTVGNVDPAFKESLMDTAASLRVGYGLEEDTQMGPVITNQARERVLSYVAKGAGEGASLPLDGRNFRPDRYPDGYFLKPTIVDHVTPEMTIAREEIFGPVLSLVHANDFEDALRVIDMSRYGNAISIFTRDGGTAREFQYRVPCGNVGINVGVAAPMAFFPFAGMKDSFFGDLHGQGRDAIEFYTDKKVVIERW